MVSRTKEIELQIAVDIRSIEGYLKKIKTSVKEKDVRMAEANATAIQVELRSVIGKMRELAAAATFPS